MALPMASSAALSPQLSINSSSSSNLRRRRTTTTASAAERNATVPPSPVETRISLVLALASQAASTSQRGLMDLAAEAAKYVFPRQLEARNLEEALMAVPDLETVKYCVLKRTEQYEIREVDPYFVAETTMLGNNGFDFNGASQGFNTLAAYLFGENSVCEQMEMTTPVYTRKTQLRNEKMDMTTPVITKQTSDSDKWQMSFVMPSKYGANLPLPKDPSVSIKEVPGKLMAVAAFSGFVSDEDVSRRELSLRKALSYDNQYQVKADAMVEVAQFNPPFTLPFTRRNEISLEVEKKT